MSKTSKKKGEPMQGSKNRLRALVLAVCLLCSVAIGRVALAEGDAFVPDASGNGGTGSLTVQLAGAATDEAYVKDLATAGVVVDVFKIASAEQVDGYLTYTYTLEGDFASLQSQLDDCVKKTEGSDAAAASREAWEAFAQAAADLAPFESGTAEVTAAGTKISNLEPGLYLVLTHGTGSTAEDPAIAQSATYEYSFEPIVIAIPTKSDLNGDGIITTAADDGEWTEDATIVLKSARERLYGSVVIDKTITGETDGKPATFVFHITETNPSPAESAEEASGKNRPYDEYASVYFDGEKIVDPALVTKIPAGITVQITEVDAGPRYDLDTTAYTRIIRTDDGTVAGAGVHVSFNNTPNGNNIDGYGIENQFEHDGATWQWHSVPTTASQQGE